MKIRTIFKGFFLAIIGVFVGFGQINDKLSLWQGSTQLRGANIYQRRVYLELDGPDFMGPGPVGPPYSQSDFNELASWGANWVNVSHPGLFTENPPYVLDRQIQANLDDLLQMISQAGMYAVISFRTGPGRCEFTFMWEEAGDWFDDSYLNDTVWNDADAQQGWIDMWRYTAERYKDNPNIVGFDLMVEPNSNEVGHDATDPLDLWDQEEFYETYGNTLYDWNQLFPRIVEKIREKDTDTPILVGGMAYSAVDWLPWLDVIQDDRMVYMVHQYAPHVYTHQQAGGSLTYPGLFDTDWDGIPDQFNRDWLVNLLMPVDEFIDQAGLPIAVNEFGAIRWVPNAAQYLDDLMDLFEERDMNHAIWLWGTFWEAHAEEDDFNFRRGPDPANHQDVNTSAFIDVIKKYWGRNEQRPTTFLKDEVRPTEPSIVLQQNTPNPFNSQTVIRYSILTRSPIQLEIFNIAGRSVLTYSVNSLDPGDYQCRWNASTLPSGVYTIRLKQGDGSLHHQSIVYKKCLLLK